MEFLAVLRAVLITLAALRQPLRQALVQPVLTVLLLIMLYAGMHVAREASLAEGLRVAFLDTEASRAERGRELENAMLQGELRHFVESNRLIDQLLQTLLQRMPNAARVRLDVIHNGVVGLSGIGLLRYDVTHSLAAPGRSTDALVQNRPMSEWTDTLPSLLAGQCVIKPITALRNLAVRSRFTAMAVDSLLACPVADVQGRLLGAVLVMWDVGDPAPTPEAAGGLMQFGQQIGAQIAAVLDLRGPPPWPSAKAPGG